jgi:hypothetical protein
MRAALILCLCSAYRLCSSQLAPIWAPCSSAGIPHGCRALAWLAHPRLRVAVRDWWRHGLRRQQCVNAAPLARSGLVNGYLVSLFPLGAMLAAPAHGLGLDWLGVRQTLAALAAVVAATAFAAALLFAGWLW